MGVDRGSGGGVNPNIITMLWCPYRAFLEMIRYRKGAKVCSVLRNHAEPATPMFLTTTKRRANDRDRGCWYSAMALACLLAAFPLRGTKTVNS